MVRSMSSKLLASAMLDKASPSAVVVSCERLFIGANDEGI